MKEEMAIILGILVFIIYRAFLKMNIDLKQVIITLILVLATPLVLYLTYMILKKLIIKRRESINLLKKNKLYL